MMQTWFITGSSRGLGRALTRAALEAGGRVAASDRQPEQLDDLVADFGDRIRPIALNVTDALGAQMAVADAHRHFGRLDVAARGKCCRRLDPSR
jgi:NAD(P)-dependent dehydrogenase (short-subunit alcohol dehydrogenase family)